MNDVQILVTGKHFTGHGLRAIEPVLKELILSAEQEIHLLAYHISGSFLPALGLLAMVLEKGIRVTLVLNRLTEHPEEVTETLARLERRFSYARVVDFRDQEGSQLHAKVLVADRRRALVGSANLSWSGMLANHEIAVLIEGNTAWTLASLIDELTHI